MRERFFCDFELVRAQIGEDLSAKAVEQGRHSESPTPDGIAVPLKRHQMQGLHWMQVQAPSLCRLSVGRACERAQFVQGEGKARGEFSGGNSAVKKSGETFPRRNFGGTVPSFATAPEGLCFPSRAKRLRTRLSQLFLTQMYEIWAADPVTRAGGTGPLCCGNVLQFWSLCLGHVLFCY